MGKFKKILSYLLIIVSAIILPSISFASSMGGGGFLLLVVIIPGLLIVSVLLLFSIAFIKFFTSIFNLNKYLTALFGSLFFIILFAGLLRYLGEYNIIFEIMIIPVVIIFVILASFVHFFLKKDYKIKHLLIPSTLAVFILILTTIVYFMILDDYSNRINSFDSRSVDDPRVCNIFLMSEQRKECLLSVVQVQARKICDNNGECRYNLYSKKIPKLMPSMSNLKEEFGECDLYAVGSSSNDFHNAANCYLWVGGHGSTRSFRPF